MNSGEFSIVEVALPAAVLLAFLIACAAAGVWLVRRTISLLTRRPRVVTMLKHRELTRRM
ncbi:hypothetical protein [Rhodopseudomonas sp. B29]|uniref:hypothetical protein n=1 Tax=Rhodopseudomonas sp. B29 TaxID=95607 RepID=UPI000346E4B3|nr:hypothetical protein [Rhodopseudomonas sp. B29]